MYRTIHFMEEQTGIAYPTMDHMLKNADHIEYAIKYATDMLESIKKDQKQYIPFTEEWIRHAMSLVELVHIYDNVNYRQGEIHDKVWVQTNVKKDKIDGSYMVYTRESTLPQNETLTTYFSRITDYRETDFLNRFITRIRDTEEGSVKYFPAFIINNKYAADLFGVLPNYNRVFKFGRYDDGEYFLEDRACSIVS